MIFPLVYYLCQTLKDLLANEAKYYPCRKLLVFLKIWLYCCKAIRNYFSFYATPNLWFYYYYHYFSAPLVPVFTFGEQNTQEVIEINNRIMHYFNTIFHKFTRIRICLINGRGILQNKFGLLPRRCRLTTVGKRKIIISIINESLHKWKAHSAVLSK